MKITATIAQLYIYNLQNKNISLGTAVFVFNILCHQVTS